MLMCGVGEKPVAHLMKFHRLQWELAKGQSVSHHDVAHLKPSTNVPTKYQLPTPYGFQDIARTRFYRSSSLQQGQTKVTP